LEEALALFTRVEHFIELQEMTHPGSAEKARRITDYVTAAFSLLGGKYEDISAVKAAVRALYQTKLS
jgi:hypothetical protein